MYIAKINFIYSPNLVLGDKYLYSNMIFKIQMVYQLLIFVVYRSYSMDDRTYRHQDHEEVPHRALVSVSPHRQLPHHHLLLGSLSPGRRISQS